MATFTIKDFNSKLDVERFENEIVKFRSYVVDDILIRNWIPLFDKYYIDIHHNLGTMNLVLSGYNKDTYQSVLFKWEIINDKSIRVFVDDPVNVSLTILHSNNSYVTDIEIESGETFTVNDQLVSVTNLYTSRKIDNDFVKASTLENLKTEIETKFTTKVDRIDHVLTDNNYSNEEKTNLHNLKTYVEGDVTKSITNNIKKINDISNKLDVNKDEINLQLQSINSELVRIVKHFSGGNATQDHSHINKEIIDHLGTDENGNLVFFNKPISGISGDHRIDFRVFEQQLQWKYLDIEEDEWKNLISLENLKGNDGITPNISVGSVVMLEAGQNATIENVGTLENPIFNFGIPKGDAYNIARPSITDSVLNLTTDKWQKVNMENNTTIVLPDVETFLEIHLVFRAESELNITFPNNIRWQEEEITIESGRTYEFIFTYIDEWLGGYIPYK